MRAIFIERYGAPEQSLVLKEVPVPKPQTSEVLIKIHAIGINFADVLKRYGIYPTTKKLPYTPGFEVSGTVEALGPEAPSFQRGQRVLALLSDGGYAEYVAAPAQRVIPIPDSMSFADAVALPVNFATAYHALFHTGVLWPGDRVLIHACAGGVGLAAVQLAKNAGAEIFGTAGSDEKIRFLKEFGVHHAINYRAQDFALEIGRLTNDEGVDIVLDSLGGETTEKSLRLLRPNGRIVAFGVASFAGKPKLQVAWEFLRRPRLDTVALLRRSVGFYGLHLSQFARRPQLMLQILGNVLAQYAEGKIKPVIGKAFPFEEVAAAHQMLEGRESIGKLVLHVKT